MTDYSQYTSKQPKPIISSLRHPPNLITLFDMKRDIAVIAKNDGLSLIDFKAWFPKAFLGQIICWSDKVEY